jgi:hypothetical protein
MVQREGKLHFSLAHQRGLVFLNHKPKVAFNFLDPRAQVGLKHKFDPLDFHPLNIGVETVIRVHALVVI